MKHEWRKHEKSLYLPKRKPEVIQVPSLKYLMIDGEGSPEQARFSECISALYSVSYTIKMTLKKAAHPPPNYVDYTVYPLEGHWSLNEQAIQNFDGTSHKKDFVYTLMIRQPDVITHELYLEMLSQAKNKGGSPLLDQLRFDSVDEGLCVQMLHVGPYENEPQSFGVMEAFAKDNGLERLSKRHKEIYLSDFRKVAPEKLKTVLRFKASKAKS